MFVAFDRRVRVHLGVVALGTPPRLRGCLDALVAHESEHDFVVSCLVNPATAYDGELDTEPPAGVRVERSGSNLGWSGGLHRLRKLSEGELFVWVQDDMTPLPGWLDALVAAADSHPRVGCFGALRVDEQDQVLPYNGGWAEPPDQVTIWNATDTSAPHRPTEVTKLDWVTSKGCLTRAKAFDEVSGPDPRLWPLNHVDKDYCTHLRAHGWDVALVPDARLLHLGGQASPTPFREFLGGWRDSWFDDRWSAAVGAMRGRSSDVVDHPCAEWRALDVDAVEASCGQAATRMVVPLARWHAERDSTQAAASGAELDRMRAELDLARAEAESLTAAVSSLEDRLRLAQRRRRRAKRRLARAEALLSEQQRSDRWWSRVARRLRA